MNISPIENSTSQRTDSDTEDAGPHLNYFKKQIVPQIGSTISSVRTTETSRSNSPSIQTRCHSPSAIVTQFNQLSNVDKKRTLEKLLQPANLPQIYLRSIFEQLRVNLSQDFCDILPDYLILSIFSYLNAKELSIASTCSKSWFQHSNNESLWQGLSKQYMFDCKLNEMTEIESNSEGENTVIFGNEQQSEDVLPEVDAYWRNHFIESYKNIHSWENAKYSIKTEIIKSDRNKQPGHTRLKLHAFCENDNTLLTVDDHDYITLWQTKNDDIIRLACISPETGISGVQSVAMSKQSIVVKSSLKGLILFDKLKSGTNKNMLDMKTTFQLSNFRTILAENEIERTGGLQFLKFSTVSDFVFFDENFLYYFKSDKVSSNGYRLKRVRTNYATEDLISFDCSRDYCAAGSWNGEVNLWKLADDMKEPKILFSHSEVVYDIKFSRDLLITGGGDGKLCIHGNLDSDGEVKLLTTIHFSTDVVKITANEYYLAAATDNEVKIYRWNKICKKLYEPESVVSSQNGSIMGSIRALEFSQAGRLVIASSQRRVSIWSCLENRVLGVIHHNPLLVGSIYVSARFVIIVSKDRPGAVSFVVYK